MDSTKRIVWRGWIFDPNQSPSSIRPLVKHKGDKLFAYGECTRTIMNALRASMTAARSAGAPGSLTIARSAAMSRAMLGRKQEHGCDKRLSL
jgi:hypothetical protein